MLYLYYDGNIASFMLYLPHFGVSTASYCYWERVGNVSVYFTLAGSIVLGFVN